MIKRQAMKAITLGVCLLVSILTIPNESVARSSKPKIRDLDLAAAYALEGMLDEARAILDAAPVSLKTLSPDDKRPLSQDRAEAERDAMQWNLLNMLIEPKVTDSFDRLTNILVKSDFGGSDPLESMIWLKVFARFAEKQKYPALAAYALERTRNSLKYRLEDSRSDPSENREALTLQSDEIAREIARMHEVSLQEESRKEGASAGEDAMAQTVKRILEAPRMVPFREVPLEPRFAPLRLTEDDADAQAKKSLQEFSLPKDFGAVRVDRQGNEAVAIGVSQDYDPVGELSRGAYWVIRSHDGGKTWGKPVYTGLRIQRPYVVRPVSNAPLLAGDHLQVEVKVQELDESSITFPPVGLRAKREKEGLILEIPFAELERDSDNDGLTDLAEERLLSDPYKPDTDGDGLPDGSDPLPQVPWTIAMDESARAFAAALGRISHGGPPAIIHEIGSPQQTLDDLLRRAKRANSSDEGTLFIIGQRTDFRPLMPTTRIVVLTESEQEVAARKFGPTFASSIQLFILDHAQRRGLVIWDASWVGGTFRLERSGEVWRVVDVSSWIT